jgi:8-oxo-dGTP pyrophosphatase MutT (NUDIX family)
VKGIPPGARPASRVLVISDDLKLLLLQGVQDGFDPWWVSPGGGLQAGESFEDAAARELLEETGSRPRSGLACGRGTTVTNGTGSRMISTNGSSWRGRGQRWTRLPSRRIVTSLDTVGGPWTKSAPRRVASRPELWRICFRRFSRANTQRTRSMLEYDASAVLRRFTSADSLDAVLRRE